MALGTKSISSVRSYAEDISKFISWTSDDIDQFMNAIAKCEDYGQFKNNTLRGQDLDTALNTLVGLLRNTLLPQASKLVSDLKVFADKQERINQ